MHGSYSTWLADVVAGGVNIEALFDSSQKQKKSKLDRNYFLSHILFQNVHIIRICM
jgi:hypothetical protein